MTALPTHIVLARRAEEGKKNLRRAPSRRDYIDSFFWRLPPPPPARERGILYRRLMIILLHPRDTRGLRCTFLFFFFFFFL